MRLALIVCLAVCGAAQAQPLHRGPWGEDPRRVPDFTLPEERRAPKVPAGAGLYAAFAREREVGAVDGALLLCYVDVDRPRKERAGRELIGIFTLGMLDGPDLTLRLTLRHEPPMVLWGPAGHRRSYVSWPAVRLTPGDRVAVSLLDRHLLSTEGLGRAEIRYSGQSPLELTHGRWSLSCAIATAPEVDRAAAPWLASVDEQLDAIEQAPLMPAKVGFGFPSEAIKLLKEPFREVSHKKGNLRYAAGFYGWEHPQIQARLERLHQLEDVWARRLRETAAARLADLPPPGTLVDGEGLGFRIGELRCPPTPARRHRGKAPGCTLALAIEWPAGPPNPSEPPRPCQQVRVTTEFIQSVDDQGLPKFTATTGIFDAQGVKICASGGSEDGEPATVVLEVDAGAKLLGERRWVGGLARIR